MTMMPAPAPSQLSAQTRLLRHLSKTLCLHGLCASSACRRARACRGDPRDCLQRYAPLVPEEAREGAKRMVDGWLQHLSFDELIEDEDVCDEVMALGDWAARVTASYPARAVAPKHNDLPTKPPGDVPQTEHSARLPRTPGPRIRML